MTFRAVLASTQDMGKTWKSIPLRGYETLAGKTSYFAKPARRNDNLEPETALRTRDVKISNRDMHEQIPDTQSTGLISFARFPTGVKHKIT